MGNDYVVKTAFTASDNVSSEIKKMSGSVNSFTRNTQNKFKELSQSTFSLRKTFATITHGFMQGLGIGTGIEIFNKMKDTIKEGINTGIEFEEAITRASSKLTNEFGKPIRKGMKEFDELSDAVRKIGHNTEFTAIQAAEALEALAKSGYNAKEAIAMLPNVVDIAKSANVDFEKATMISAITLKQFNMNVKDAVQLEKNLTRVNDVMSKSVSTSQLSMEDLLETFQQTAPIATKLGISIEEITTLASALSDTAKGAKAGMMLKQLFIPLLAPSKSMENILDRLGIRLRNSKGEFVGIIDIINQFQKALKGKGAVEQSQILSKIFGRRGVIGATRLINIGSEELNKINAGMLNAQGSAKTLAEIVDNTVGDKLKELKSAAQSIWISLFTIGKSDFSGLIENITKIVRAVDDWINNNKELISKQFKEIGEFVKQFMEGFDAKKIGEFFAKSKEGALDFLDILHMTAVTLRAIAKLILFIAHPFRTATKKELSVLQETDFIENALNTASDRIGFGGNWGDKLKEYRINKFNNLIKEKNKQNNNNTEDNTYQIPKTKTVENYINQENIKKETILSRENYLNINFNNKPKEVSVESNFSSPSLKLNRGRR
jgi:TP901 family phage tail tape measure protein